MKTPIQELLAYTADLLHTFDSEERVAMAVLDYLKSNKDAILEKEKDTIVEAFKEGVKYWNGDEYKLIDVEQYYNLTFNTKEK